MVGSHPGSSRLRLINTIYRLMTGTRRHEQLEPLARISSGVSSFLEQVDRI
jgi:hypothetical protein